MENEKQRIEPEERCVKLTEDLMIEIISRLSVKDIFRFMCVSKSWCSFINTDSYLSKLQFQRTASFDPPSLLITKIHNVYKGNKLYCNELLDFGSLEDVNINLTEIDNPFDVEDKNDGFPRHDTKVIGSCDGLLVLRQRPSRKMVVLNPTTNKYHVVPPNPAGDGNVRFFGFGHDHVCDCYKLVTKIKNSNHGVVELMIYNVNSGTWRRKSQFKDDYYYDLSEFCYWKAAYFDGGLYWCDEVDERYSNQVIMIVCFDLGEEEFGEIQSPDGFVGKEIRGRLDINVFDGKLCFVCEGWDDNIDMWMYDKEESCWRWNQLLSIPIPERILQKIVLTPVCFSACSKRILFVRDGIVELFWYDLENKKVSKLTNIRFFEESRMRMFVPSLIGNGILEAVYKI